MNEDELRIMLARIETLASLNAVLGRDIKIAERRSDILSAVQSERDRLRRELKAAEDKVGEWAEYSSSLRSLISPRRKSELPEMPKPLETEIPF